MPQHWIVFGLCLTAFGCLALAMERHQEDLWGAGLAVRTTRALRSLGWLLLAAALALAVRQQGWSFGLAALFGHSSASAAIVLLGLLALERSKARKRR